MNLKPFAAVAATHHGLIHQRSALELGMSRTTWYRQADRGIFELIHPNVARLVGSPNSREQRILAAVWAAGVARASHRSAAHLWSVERPEDDPVDIILLERNRQATLDGVVVHRPRDRRELRAIYRCGIPTVTPMRVLTDLGAVDPDGVFPALETLLLTRALSWGAVIGGLRRHAKKGHHGIGALREALDEWQIGGKPSDGKLELKMNELLRTFRLPPAEFHAIVCGYEVDFLISGTNVVLECEGFESHGLNRDQFEFDRLRHSDVTAHGYVIVPFTWRQVTQGPAKVAARIERNLEQWAPEVLERHRATRSGR